MTSDENREPIDDYIYKIDLIDPTGRTVVMTVGGADYLTAEDKIRRIAERSPGWSLAVDDA